MTRSHFYSKATIGIPSCLQPADMAVSSVSEQGGETIVASGGKAAPCHAETIVVCNESQADECMGNGAVPYPSWNLEAGTSLQSNHIAQLAGASIDPLLMSMMLGPHSNGASTGSTSSTSSIKGSSASGEENLK